MTIAAFEEPVEDGYTEGSGVLVVDDEEGIRLAVGAQLREDGHRVVTVASGGACLEHLDGDLPEVVLLDYRLPDADGIAVLEEIRHRAPATQVIMLTGYSGVETVVRAMKAGAFHFVSKPVDLGELANLVRRAVETNRLKREVRELRQQRRRDWGLRQLIGASPSIRRTKQLVRKFAGSPSSTILVTGESGTGKDLIARAVHAHGQRADGPFTNITCSALPDTLLESELFGYEKGAFTGADRPKSGLFELSDGGTAFLDEIGEMSLTCQAKVLRLLESKAFRRLGGTRDLRADVRIVAATHRDLEGEVRAGRFREDLYYRLTVLQVRVPPLRERTGDVPLLVAHFVERFSRAFHKQVRGVEPRTMDRLARRPWPGNVRELRNVVERAVLLAEGSALGDADFEWRDERPGAAGGPDPFQLPADGVDLAELERSLLVQALRRAEGNKTRAGKLLGINRDQVRSRIARYGVDEDDVSSSA